ncbi:hypothetical protein SJI19_16900 [Acerihabitans sp. TG2]|uniref:type IVB secretion system protein IcmW n=1 Tax=Acerihabitans sp. TG2 TaxID=3096008 RepID=UPI002B23D620|nr:hypothetical protein [Acerihabitans sp. TG2]MEA9392205.1 hypothetical protein [Acerihabitans sp. TG2]
MSLIKNDHSDVKSLNLSTENINDFFFDQGVYDALKRYIDKLDSVDRWAFDFGVGDNEAVSAAIADIEKIFSQHSELLHLFPKKVFYVLSNIKTSRCLYLINYLCSVNPLFLEMLEKFLYEGFSEDSESAISTDSHIISQRLQVVDRTKLLEKVFSKSRYEYINRLMRRGAVQ